MARKKQASISAVVGVVLAAVLVLIARSYWPEVFSDSHHGPAEQRDGDTVATAEDHSAGAASITPDSDDVLALFRERRSGEMVRIEGVAFRLLADDAEGDRHQKFLVRVAGTDHTLLVAHNIDLALRVPLEAGDSVTIYGQYEWSDKGGTLHWTHHDPRGWREGGWIEHAGTRYE